MTVKIIEQLEIIGIDRDDDSAMHLTSFQGFHSSLIKAVSVVESCQGINIRMTLKFLLLIPDRHKILIKEGNADAHQYR